MSRILIAYDLKNNFTYIGEHVADRTATFGAFLEGRRDDSVHLRAVQVVPTEPSVHVRSRLRSLYLRAEHDRKREETSETAIKLDSILASHDLGTIGGDENE